MKNPALTLVTASRPLVIGHRGYSSVAPENTLPSFELAIAAGVDLVELDYHVSRDSVLMVIHDFTLDRTTDATNRWGGVKIPVKTKTAAEMQTLDAGKWFAPRYAGTRLPRLTEALRAIHKRGGVTLIERKAGSAASLAELLRREHLVNQVIVQSFDWQFLRELHALLPEQVLGALGTPARLADGSSPKGRSKPLDIRWLNDLAATGARAVVWHKEVSARAVAEAHRRGLKVWIYTIDDAPTARHLLDLGVDGLITNNPGRMWRTLALYAIERTKGH